MATLGQKHRDKTYNRCGIINVAMTICIKRQVMSIEQFVFYKTTYDRLSINNENVAVGVYFLLFYQLGYVCSAAS